MKFIKILIIGLFFTGPVMGQRISFPAPELRADTIRSLGISNITMASPVVVSRSLTVNATGLPPTWLLQAIDSVGYRRFGITRNGLFTSGTGHDPQVNIDALALIGRSNALKGTDAFVIGKGINNLADTTMALGYYYTVPGNKQNMAIIGYGDNRIEMSADSGRFIGKWKLGGNGSGVTTETDPTVPGHVKTITTGNIANWNTSFGWGNHASAGYLNTETDPKWTTDKASYYTQIQTKALVKDTAVVLRGLIKTAAGGGITQESDPTVPSHIKNISTTNISNWNTSFGWGNHASAGYLNTETDPKWTADKASYYTQTQTKTLVKDTAVVLRGLIKAVGGITTETDPTVSSHVKSISTANISNWNNAYGWGNHATQGYLKTFTESDPGVPDYVKSITISNISCWNNAYADSHSHANKTILDGITSTSIANWNAAYNYSSEISSLKKRMSGDPVTYTFSSLDVTTGYGIYYVETNASNVSFPSHSLYNNMELGREITIYWKNSYSSTSLLNFPLGYDMVTGSGGNWTMAPGAYYIKVYKAFQNGQLTIMVLPKPQWP